MIARIFAALLFAGFSAIVLPDTGLGADRAASVQVAEGGAYVAFPATGVRLRPPPGFEQADRFHGFQQPTTGSSVMVTMMPGPYGQSVAGFTEEGLRKAGMLLVNKEPRTVAGFDGMLVAVAQLVSGVKFGKWLLVFGNDKQTYLVAAMFPLELEQQLADPLLQSVLSVELDDTPPPDPTVAAGFRIEPSGGLELMPQGAAMGKTLMYSLKARPISGDLGTPFFLAAISHGQGDMRDRRGFALQRLNNLPQVTVLGEPRVDKIKIDGLDGYEIHARARHERMTGEVALYQVMLFDDHGYFLMVGRVDQARSAKYMKVFEKMARSLKRG